jgi:5-methylcytosine-specific restriction protein A
MEMNSSSKSWRKDKTTSAQRGYGYRWQKARKAYLDKHVLCVMCQQEGLITIATVVDHKKPHEGDYQLFWDSSNWQSLCERHHNRDKKQLEATGKINPRIGIDGWPE